MPFSTINFCRAYRATTKKESKIPSGLFFSYLPMKKTKVDPHCLKHGHCFSTRKWQTFKDGTTHLRLECENCGRLDQYLDQEDRNNFQKWSMLFSPSCNHSSKEPAHVGKHSAGRSAMKNTWGINLARCRSGKDCCIISVYNPPHGERGWACRNTRVRSET